MQREPTRRWHLLAAFGVAQVTLGVSWLFPPPLGARSRGFDWLWWLEPGHAGVLMIFTGALALVTVIVQKFKRVNMLERIAFSAILAPFLILSLIFLLSWLFGGNGSGWISAISYGAYGALAYLSAGVTDTPDNLTTASTPVVRTP